VPSKVRRSQQRRKRRFTVHETVARVVILARQKPIELPPDPTDRVDQQRLDVHILAQLLQNVILSGAERSRRTLPAGLGSPRPAANRRIERSFGRGALMAYVYILASWRRVLYVGGTSNLRRRIAQHRSACLGGFTARYHVHRLVHV
jgi:hypothetical protein